MIDVKKIKEKSKKNLKNILNSKNSEDDLVNEIKCNNRKSIELNKLKLHKKTNTPIYYISKISKKNFFPKELNNSKRSDHTKSEHILKKMKSELIELKTKYKLDIKI